MTTRKQEFYEGAALHLLARTGHVQSIRHEPPFFLLNDRLLVHLKYSTRGRSPWGFTFMPDEQLLLERRASKVKLVIGLICGSDGVATLSYQDYRSIGSPRRSSIHIACYRQHREHYQLAGPDGELDTKVAPSLWRTILDT